MKKFSNKFTLALLLGFAISPLSPALAESKDQPESRKHELAESAREVAAEVGKKIRKAAHEAQEKIKEKGGEWKDKGKEWWKDLVDFFRSSDEEEFKAWLHENLKDSDKETLKRMAKRLQKAHDEEKKKDHEVDNFDENMRVFTDYADSKND